MKDASSKLRSYSIQTIGALLMTWAGTSQAKVKEITSMREIQASVDAQTLVVFDIDNTLLQTTQELGSVQWTEFMSRRLHTQGYDAAAAQDQANQMFGQVQPWITMAPVEASTPALTRRLQDRGARLLALTARTEELEQTTQRQLASSGIALERHPLGAMTPLSFTTPFPIHYQRQVLFVGSNNKGQVLVQFMQSLAQKPGNVVFVDDKLHNVEQVDAALTAAGITVTSYRYGAADLLVSQFQEDVAIREWDFFQEFGAVLTDDDAQFPSYE